MLTTYPHLLQYLRDHGACNGAEISKLNNKELHGMSVLRQPSVIVIYKLEIETKMEPCQIKVQEGILQGKECKTYYGKKYYSFEGIPYAKPPVGKLRFRDPQPPEPWLDILDATKPGNKAMQSNPYSSTPIDGSEDCLYLNIYTPVLPTERNKKLPVIFLIHGGRLIFGYGNYYTPDYILKHDVILVTINYRLNILGWLCLNLPECPGNAGLKDAAMALKWINKNIHNFNGDSGNITVSGESAGAAMATSFLTSKVTEGLYSKVIVQSGNSISDFYLIEEDSIKKAIKIASLLGQNLTDERELYDFLVKAPIEDLIIAFTEAELSRPRAVINALFLPVVEKTFEGVEPFFTEHPRLAITENRFHKVPMLTALNSHEGAIFFNDNGNVLYEEDFYYFIPQYMHVQKDTSEAKILESQIRSFYIGDRKLNDEVKEEYIEMVSDVVLWRDTYQFAEKVSKYWDQLYLLQFNYSGNMHTRVMNSIGMKGATHGDLIQYLFYRKGKAAKASKKDFEIVELLSEMFCNFAKTGKPTWTAQSLEWLPYTNDQKRTLLIDDQITLAYDHGVKRLEFWMELTKENKNTSSKL